MDMKNFFNPSEIALIGASDHLEKVGGILADKLKDYKHKFIPINPKHKSIFGIKCYKSVLDYPKNIDLAVIAVPALFIPQVLEECGKKGIKMVIIITAGFSEIGNSHGEEELKQIAHKYGIRFIGPNCFGICNPSNRLDTTFSATTPKKGEIAFISQSGALWSYISDFAGDEIGFSGFASLGNMADLEFSDFIDYFSKDKSTKAIVLYVEKLKDGKRFIETAKKCKKPIFAVKAGISAEGSRAAVSHTGSLATDYEIYRGAFKQAGVILCDSLIEAFEKAGKKELLDKTKNKSVKIGKKTIIITNAGGAGALMADYLSLKKLDVSGPIDILGTASGSDYFNAFEKIKDRDFDSIIVILTPQSMSEIKKTAEVIAGFKNRINNQIIALFLGKKSMKEANNIFEENKIPYFNTLEEARMSINF